LRAYDITGKRTTLELLEGYLKYLEAEELKKKDKVYNPGVENPSQESLPKYVN